MEGGRLCSSREVEPPAQPQLPPPRTQSPSASDIMLNLPLVLTSPQPPQTTRATPSTMIPPEYRPPRPRPSQPSGPRKSSLLRNPRLRGLHAQRALRSDSEHRSSQPMAARRLVPAPFASGRVNVSRKLGGLGWVFAGVLLLRAGGGSAGGGGVGAASGIVNAVWAGRGAGSSCFGLGGGLQGDRIKFARGTRSSMQMRGSLPLYAHSKPAKSRRASSPNEQHQRSTSDGNEDKRQEHQRSLSRDKRLLTDKLRRALRPESSLFKTSRSFIPHRIIKKDFEKMSSWKQEGLATLTEGRNRSNLESPSHDLRSDPKHRLPPTPSPSEPTLPIGSFRRGVLPPDPSAPLRTNRKPDAGTLTTIDGTVNDGTMNGAQREQGASVANTSARGRAAVGETTGVGGASLASENNNTVRMRDFVPGKKATGKDAAFEGGKHEKAAQGPGQKGARIDSSSRTVEGWDTVDDKEERPVTEKRPILPRCLPVDDSTTAFRDYTFAGPSRGGGAKPTDESGGLLLLHKVVRLLSAPPPVRRMARSDLASSDSAAAEPVTFQSRRSSSSSSSSSRGEESARPKNSDPPVSDEDEELRASRLKGKIFQVNPPMREIKINFTPDALRVSPLRCITTNSDLYGIALSERVTELSRTEQAAYMENWLWNAVEHGVAPPELQALLPEDDGSHRDKRLQYPGTNGGSAGNGRYAKGGEEGDARPEGSTSREEISFNDGAKRADDPRKTSATTVDASHDDSWQAYGWIRFDRVDDAGSATNETDIEACSDSSSEEEGGYSVVGSGDRRGSQDGVAGKVSAALVGSGEKKSNGHGGKELSEYDESENTDRSASTGTAASSSPGRQSRASARKGKGARGRWRRKKTKAEPETLGNRELKAVEKKAEPETLGNRVLRAVEKRRLAPRIIVIGDVHGCLDELKELVKKVAYWPGDLLLFLGDLVAKGPDSAGVVKMARQLGGVTVRGNHEFEVLRTMDTNATYGKGSSEYRAIANQMNEEDVLWIMNSPWFFECNDLDALFVHAGFVPNVQPRNQNPRHMMNMRSIFPDGEASSKHVEDGPWASTWRGPQTVYFGHDAWRGLQSFEHAVGLDTGCVYGGQLTACILPDKQLVSVASRKPYAHFRRPAHK